MLAASAPIDLVNIAMMVVVIVIFIMIFIIVIFITWMSRRAMSAISAPLSKSVKKIVTTWNPDFVTFCKSKQTKSKRWTDKNSKKESY